MKKINISIYGLFLSFLLLFSCKEQEVKFNADNALFQAIQVQKFDYNNSKGVGTIFKGVYSENKDTVYFHVTHFPDESAPTYTDWQIQGTLASGVLISPSLAGIQDFTNEKKYTITASDGISKKEVVLKMLIYQIEYGDLEYGFGRHNKLFEKNAADLGLIADYQRSMAAVNDYLVVANGTDPFLVYNKRTGAKVNITIPKPTGLYAWSVFTDDSGILHASNAAGFSSSEVGTVSIYRWKNGIDAQPELFHQFNTSGISISGSGYVSNAAIKGSTSSNAQIMFDFDGRGKAENRAIRVSIKNGIPEKAIDVFATPVGSVWNGKAIPMSSEGRVPFVGVMLGFPPSMGVQSAAGTALFNVNPANTNFYNMIIAGAHYFEFNNAKYLAVSTCNWGSDYRLLIFNMDDLSLVGTSKDNPSEFEAFNPFSEDLLFKNVASAGDITVQVQPDGKTALVYVLGAQAGIAAYELTIVGGK